ncbi:hypothetical protein MITS9504_00640 [Synechococcus sp. MIT S9504]|nr:hypothetical protein MITS9504_00640 [Synechococcus sp. MIT S9504]
MLIKLMRVLRGGQLYVLALFRILVHAVLAIVVVISDIEGLLSPWSGAERELMLPVD